MSNFSKLNDLEVMTRTQELVSKERAITIEILWLLREIESRRIYANYGVSSLYEYAVKILGYSEGGAMRRVNASRLLKEMPELATQIENGSLSLSNVTEVHGFIKREAQQGKTYTTEEKREILKSVENQSKRDCQKVLAAISPVSMLPQETQRVLTPTHTQVSITLDQETLDQLNHIKALLAHSHPGTSYADIIKYMSELTLEKIDPIRKAQRAQVRQEKKLQPTPPVEPSEPKESKSETSSGKREYIKAATLHQVWLRDGDACTYKDLKTGRICGSKYALQIDHRIPLARNGKSDVDSLRVLCASHNRSEAIRILSWDTMRPYLRK